MVDRNKDIPPCNQKTLLTAQRPNFPFPFRCFWTLFGLGIVVDNHCNRYFFPLFIQTSLSREKYFPAAFA